jgi:hypothetical protein
MALHRILADLFDHPGKIVAAVLVFGGLFMCRTSRPKGSRTRRGRGGSRLPGPRRRSVCSC